MTIGNGNDLKPCIALYMHKKMHARVLSHAGKPSMAKQHMVGSAAGVHEKAESASSLKTQVGTSAMGLESHIEDLAQG